MRISRFLAKLKLTRRQRLTIEFFKRYSVEMKDVDKNSFSLKETKKGMSIETMINGLEPEHDAADRRLLFDVTGIKLDENDYQDESSLDEDDDLEPPPSPDR